MLAGHDLLVKGSDVVGTQDMRLAAGNNLTVTTAAEQRDESRIFDGKIYITTDVDSHNVTNGWKMFDRRGKRMGTYDSDLNRIKD
jgi:hypothetical protein